MKPSELFAKGWKPFDVDGDAVLLSPDEAGAMRFVGDKPGVEFPVASVLWKGEPVSESEFSGMLSAD